MVVISFQWTSLAVPTTNRVHTLTGVTFVASQNFVLRCCHLCFKNLSDFLYYKLSQICSLTVVGANVLSSVFLWTVLAVPTINSVYTFTGVTFVTPHNLVLSSFNLCFYEPFWLSLLWIAYILTCVTFVVSHNLVLRFCHLCVYEPFWLSLLLTAYLPSQESHLDVPNLPNTCETKSQGK